MTGKERPWERGKRGSGITKMAEKLEKQKRTNLAKTREAVEAVAATISSAEISITLDSKFRLLEIRGPDGKILSRQETTQSSISNEAKGAPTSK